MRMQPCDGIHLFFACRWTGVFLWSKGEHMKKIAVLAAILEEPDLHQEAFNAVVSEFKGIVKGRMGIPSPEYQMSMIAMIVQGEMDEINHLTGKLGNIAGVSVKTAISKKEIAE